MKLSIVVPVYRVEATLERCLESVVSQDYDDLEIILIEDGSPDSCPQMCDEWALKDLRIKVIHKSNGGLGDSRNAGVRAATGQYVTFLDSDDYLQPNTYGSLMKFLTDNPDYDFVEFPVAVHFGSKRQSWLEFEDRMFDDINDYWTSLHAHRHCYVWNKLFKRSLFDGVLFPVGHVFDDANTFPRVLRKCRRVATSCHGLYYYCDNSKGLTATADGNQLELLLKSQLNSGMPIDDICYMDLVNIQMDVYELTQAPVILPERKVNLTPLRGKQLVKGVFLNCLGISNLCKINKLLHKVWRSR